MSTAPIVTVAALIHRRDGRLLLVRSPKWGNRWALPAGKVEAGESLSAAVRREVAEETGLQIQELRSLGVQEIIHSSEFAEPAHFVSHAWAARADSDAVQLNHEHTEFAWLSRREALGCELNTPTRELIEQQPGGLGRIAIADLHIDCIVGILPAEREREQPLHLDLDLTVDIAHPARSGDIDDTVDYAATAERVSQLVRDRRYELLETMVEDIAELMLADPHVFGVKVKAAKPEAIPAAGAAVVEIVRGFY